jgi:hypothetical protein
MALQRVQGKESRPQGRCGKAESVEKQSSKQFVGFLVDRPVGLAIACFKGLGGKAPGGGQPGIQIIKMLAVDPQNQPGGQFADQDDRYSYDQGAEKVIQYRYARKSI